MTTISSGVRLADWINGTSAEGISVFGQALDPRFIDSMSLIDGALPAEYGLRTAGIIDITTKSGVQSPGGSVSVYGGSHGEIEPSFIYGGGSGAFSCLVTDKEYETRNGTGLGAGVPKLGRGAASSSAYRNRSARGLERARRATDRPIQSPELNCCQARENARASSGA